MNRKDFFEQSFVCAVKSFICIGPFIGGVYMAATSGLATSGGIPSGGPGLAFLILFIVYSYVSGFLPALVAATVWYALVNVIAYVNLEKLLGMPLAFLLGSLILSGLAGYYGVMSVVHSAAHINPSFAHAGAVAGCVAGFMSANGVLKRAEV